MTAVAMSNPHNGVRAGGALKLHRGGAFGEVSKTAIRPEPRTNPSIVQIGTALAKSNPISSGAAHFGGGGGRGGARNRADRESFALTAAQIGNLRAATWHASAIGLPFTRMVTIHWQAAGVALEDMPKATGRLIDLMTKALARHGSPTAWLWVHENAQDKSQHGREKGGHCHMLVHIPAFAVAKVSALRNGWLRGIVGQAYRKGVLRSKPIGGRLGLEVSNPPLHAVNLEGALAYVLKGASPDAAAQFSLEQQSPQGRIIGKRCGVSQNIGAKARKAKD